MTQLLRSVSPRPTEMGPPIPVLSDLLGDIQALNDEVAELRGALASRAVIDQAKGMLMLEHRIDAQAAFALMTRLSQNSNVKVRLIAESMVTSGHRGNQGPGVSGSVAAQGTPRLAARVRRHGGLLR